MSSRRRPRQQQVQHDAPSPSSSLKRKKYKEDEDGPYNSSVVASLLTPHTQRLLKLVQEGTASHAQHAALHLREIAARSSPLVLWDLLGRLQALLIGDTETNDDKDASSNWSCRQHAQWAMQGVARCLPKSDQDEFLTNSIPTNSTTSPETLAEAKHLWLTVQDLDVDAVLQQGMLLLAAPEQKYDEDALRLQRLDEQSESVDDFVQKRIQLQRRILAKRLGLGAIVQATGNADEWLPDTLTSHDYLATSASTAENSQSTKASSSDSASGKKEGRRKTNIKKSVRALLVMEMSQQTNDAGTGGASMVVSHQNPQQLLATELLYRMFDPHWHVRHGALLGISSLLQAWHTSKSVTNGTDATTTSSFGAWPQDLLARSLCILALDRFADFSGDATVAPVRLASAQVVAWLYHLAPSDIQASCRRKVRQLAGHFGDDWEVRHGGLVAIQFLLVVVENKKDMEEFGLIAVQALSDECDDVVAVAARVLLTLLKRQSGTVDTSYMSTLWSALVKIESSVSSSAVPLVTLFSELMPIHEGHLPATIEEVWRKMMRFLDFSSSSIQISTMEALTCMVD